MSSTTPSEKYSCFGSSLMLTNGSTAIEGLSGSASAGLCASPTPSSFARKTRTGSSMFLRRSSPRSSKPSDTFCFTCSIDRSRDADAARLGELLQPRCNVDGIAVAILTLDDDIADMYPHAHIDPLVWG